jgi:uncharacterized membrane protein YdjX (TVP38/TMEM64 family)
MLSSFVHWYLQALDTGGYALVVLLMAVESSIVPLPSEVVIPPAAYLAVTTGKMTLLGVVLAGTVGSWIGASVMYLAARYLGRPLLVRFGAFIFLTETKLAAAERWTSSVGPYGVFAARLLPVIRHLIGIPVGLMRMHYGWFSLATLCGALVWSAVLCWIGVTAGQDAALLAGDMHRVTRWCVGIFVSLLVLYGLFVYRPMRRQ